MEKCENNIPYKKIDCDQDALYLDDQSQMWLCFWCWWESVYADMRDYLLKAGLTIPEDQRPKELKNK